MVEGIYSSVQDFYLDSHLLNLTLRSPLLPLVLSTLQEISATLLALVHPWSPSTCPPISRRHTLAFWDQWPPFFAPVLASLVNNQTA